MTLKHLRLALGMAILHMTPVIVMAAEHKPIKPVSGYVCMALDAPDSVMMNFDHPIPLQTEPRDGAPMIAPALGVLPVATNVPEMNGYVQSMNLAFKTGWVPAKYVKPYAKVHPGNTCTPYVMDDGKLGFVFGH